MIEYILKLEYFILENLLHFKQFNNMEELTFDSYICIKNINCYKHKENSYQTNQ